MLDSHLLVDLLTDQIRIFRLEYDHSLSQFLLDVDIHTGSFGTLVVFFCKA